MAISQFKHVKITGIDYVIPSNICRNIDDYIHLFDNSTKKLERAKKIIGYGPRYSAPEGITTVDICVQSAEHLISKLNIDKSTIDAVILVTQTPDYISPASAQIIQKELGLQKSCAVFDVTQGCTGYVYGLWLASSLIESRASKRVLLCSGDVVRFDPDLDQKASLLFSDAGCSTILEYSDDEVYSFYLIGSDGYQYEAMLSPSSGARLPVNTETLNTIITDKDGNRWRLNGSFMDGLAVFDFTMNVIPEHIKELLSVSNFQIDDIEFIGVHQANKQIVETLVSKAGIPENKYSINTFINYGNTAGTSCILNVLDSFQCDFKNTENNIALVSFGAGLSWASAILQFNFLQYSDIRLVPFNVKRTYKEEFEYWKNKIENYSASK